MSRLNTSSNIAHPDDIYELLIDLHQGLSEAQSRRVNARLVLLLVNHIGDEHVIRAAIAAARQTLASESRDME
jgi:hypothetical protein